MCVLATISAEASCMLETTNTLKFAARAKLLPVASAANGAAALRPPPGMAALAEENMQLLQANAQLRDEIQVLQQQRQPSADCADHERTIQRLHDALADAENERRDLEAEVRDKEAIIHALRAANRKREVAELRSFERYLDSGNGPVSKPVSAPRLGDSARTDRESNTYMQDRNLLPRRESFDKQALQGHETHGKEATTASRDGHGKENNQPRALQEIAENVVL